MPNFFSLKSKKSLHPTTELFKKATEPENLGTGEDEVIKDCELESYQIKLES